MEEKKSPYIHKTWQEFKDSGLLWFVNTILHTFGWAIVIYEDEGGIQEIYPARTKYRGFPQFVNEKGYIAITEYLKQEIDELLIEAKE